MKQTLARLHLHALAHPNAFLAFVFTTIFLGRLAHTNPSFAFAVAALLLAITWHELLPQHKKLSNARLAVTALLALVATSLLFASPAEAISLGGIARSLKNDMGSIYDAIVYACYGGGITTTAVGINNGIKKSKGDQQVTTGSIFGYGLGGPCLGMIGYIMDSAGESMGGGASSMNKLPGGL